MATFKAWHPRNYSLVSDLSADIVTLSYNANLNGSLGGEAVIEVTPANRALVESFKENSHFIEVARDGFRSEGAVIEASVIVGNQATVSIIGFWEYAAKIDVWPSHKALASNVVYTPDDMSVVKTFYSDTAEGLLFEVVYNVRQVMDNRGFSTPITANPLLAVMESQDDVKWGKSYRLNGLELPTLQAVLSDIFSDAELNQLKITLSTSNDRFVWVIDTFQSYVVHTIDEAIAEVHTVNIERSDQQARSFSLMTGTNLNDDDAVSMLPMDGGVAYSVLMPESPKAATDAIERLNDAQIADAARKKDQITFTTFDTSIGLLDGIKISGQKLSEIQAIVTEYEVEGQEVTYTAQIVDSLDSIVSGLRRPSSFVRRAIYNPLGSAQSTARKTAYKKDVSTGWRS